MFNSFQGTATFAEEVNSEKEVTNDTTNIEQEQTENIEQQDSTNTEKTSSGGTPSTEKKDENIKVQSNSEGTEFVKAILRDDGDTLLKSSKRMVMYAGVQISGVDTQLNGAYMMLSFSSTNVTSVKASTGIAMPKDPPVENKDGNYNIRYDYPNLSGGMKIELPVIFNVKSFSEDSEYIEIPVKATLYDSDGNIQGEEELIFKRERKFSLSFNTSPSYTSNSYIEAY